MNISEYKTQIIEGEDLRLSLEWIEELTENPIDLTGSTLTMESNIEGFDQPLTITDAVNGKFDFHLDKSKTLDFLGDALHKRIKYLVKRTTGTGDVNYIMRVEVNVYADHE